MKYTDFTSTATMKLDIRWCCSECKRKNEHAFFFSEIGSSRRNGWVHSEKNIQYQNEVASERAKRKMIKRLNKIIKEAEQGKYRTACIVCKCPVCGHVEPWAKLAFAEFETVLLSFVLVATFIAACAFSQDMLALTIAICAGVFVCAVWFLYKFFRYNYLERKIKELPVKSLPTLILKHNYKEIILNPDVEIRKRNITE